MTDTPQPWSRREDETSKSYRAFCIYRDLGVSRSIPKAWDVYQEESGLKAGDPTGTFKNWCCDNDWVARAQAWDDHEDAMRLLARDMARQNARDKFVEYAERLAIKLVDVALGADDAGRDQVKAILEALDRAGITVPKELQVEHTGKGGGPIETDQVKRHEFTDETHLEIAKILHDVGAINIKAARRSAPADDPEG